MDGDLADVVRIGRPVLRHVAPPSSERKTPIPGEVAGLLS
jgi:hypothetical protein